MALTQEQREARKPGLFSSDIARIMTGQSVQVALEKLGVQPEPDFEGVQEIELGELTEPFILEAYENKYGVKLQRSPEFIHPILPWMGSHPDGVLEGHSVQESKTVGVYNISEWGNPGTDQVNFYTLWQSVTHMACADVDRVDVIACFMTLEATKYLLLKQPPPIHVFHIYRDFEAEEIMLRKAKFVYDCILRGESPPPETVSDARLIWSKAQNVQIEATEGMVVAYNELMRLRQAVKELESQRDKKQVELMAYMKEANALTFNNQILATWKNDRDTVTLDKKKLEEEQPDIYKQYLVPKKGARKFLPKELKGK